MRTFNFLGYIITITKKLASQETIFYDIHEAVYPSFWQRRKIKKWAESLIESEGIGNTALGYEALTRVIVGIYDVSLHFQIKIKLIKASREKWGWTLRQAKDVVESIIGA